MTWRWSRLRRLAPAALVIFVAGNGLPRGSVVVHQHVGGDRPHVHLGEVEDGDAAEHAHDRDHHHHHHPPRRHDGVGLEEQDLFGVFHVHAKQPYRRAAVTRVAAPTPGTRVDPLALDPPGEPLLARIPPTLPRGPPGLS
jgi:hypothetical protein